MRCVNIARPNTVTKQDERAVSGLRRNNAGVVSLASSLRHFALLPGKVKGGKLTRTAPPSAVNSRYRSVVGRKKRSAVGFLDGDFLERFLTLDSKTREDIVEGANPAEGLKLPEYSIDQILKDFQRIH